eukprot:c6708_g1_i2.p1 GENE.c6708_g1_i2~~c6708_g1_i2.p1  ORF type:complete len:223 (-),score=44.03 c6708_g1_i2:82-750(-)
MGYETAHVIWNLVYGIVYIVLVIPLAYYGLRLAVELHSHGACISPELQHNSWGQVCGVTSMIIICFSSRAVYNFIVISGRWTMFMANLDGVAVFLVILWDIVPTAMLLVLFRHIPDSGSLATRLISHKDPLLEAIPRYDSSHTFNNPRRYDSDDDADQNQLAQSVSSHVPLPDGISEFSSSPTRPFVFNSVVSPRKVVTQLSNDGSEAGSGDVFAKPSRPSV